MIGLADGEEYVMRPVEHGLCTYRDLTSGAVDLADVARMNEFLDMKVENELRIRAAQKPPPRS